MALNFIEPAWRVVEFAHGILPKIAKREILSGNVRINNKVVVDPTEIIDVKTGIPVIIGDNLVKIHGYVQGIIE